jgi:protein-S-isoprenylcysteine O-methyltransferase Ste14
MSDTTGHLIAWCWIAWLAYWLLMALSNKRTIERGGLIGYRVVPLVIVGGWFFATRVLHLSSQSWLWQTGPALGVVTVLMVVAGALFTVWARVTLGRNWSAEVEFKQDHELIESGPYALARHPIYTGLIVMGLGTAINYGRAFGFALFFALCGSLWWKARQEERLMSSHFPRAYADYKARVRAVIPYVL